MQKRHSKKATLSLLLAMTMIFSFLPISALAETGPDFTAAQSATVTASGITVGEFGYTEGDVTIPLTGSFSYETKVINAADTDLSAFIADVNTSNIHATAKAKNGGVDLAGALLGADGIPSEYSIASCGGQFVGLSIPLTKIAEAIGADLGDTITVRHNSPLMVMYTGAEQVGESDKTAYLDTTYTVSNLGDGGIAENLNILVSSKNIYSHDDNTSLQIYDGDPAGDPAGDLLFTITLDRSGLVFNAGTAVTAKLFRHNGTTPTEEDNSKTPDVVAFPTDILDGINDSSVPGDQATGNNNLMYRLSGDKYSAVRALDGTIPLRWEPNLTNDKYKNTVIGAAVTKAGASAAGKAYLLVFDGSYTGDLVQTGYFGSYFGGAIVPAASSLTFFATEPGKYTITLSLYDVSLGAVGKTYGQNNTDGTPNVIPAGTPVLAAATHTVDIPAKGVAPGNGGDNTVDIPISVDTDTGAVTVAPDTQTNETLITDAKAKADEAGGDAVPTVTIDLASVENATAAVLSAETAQTFGDSEVAVTVKLPDAKITMDANTLKTLSEEAGTGEIKVEAALMTGSDLSGAQQSAVKGTETIVNIDVFAGGTKVNVPLTVSIPYTLQPGEKASSVCVWYLDDDGTLTKIPCTYDSATGMATFTITHQSVFVVGYSSGYTVSLDAGTGTGSWPTLNKAEGATCTITAGSLAAFTRPGMKAAFFLGSNGKRYGKGDKFAVTEDITLTAKYIRTKGPSGFNLTQEGKNIRVKYSKISYADGYQLQISTESSFASAATGTANKNGYVKNIVKTCKGKALKKGTTYYVRARAFVLCDSGKKVYTGWTTASIKMS